MMAGKKTVYRMWNEWIEKKEYTELKNGMRVVSVKTERDLQGVLDDVPTTEENVTVDPGQEEEHF